MKNFKNHIDMIVDKILNEEITKKSDDLATQVVKRAKNILNEKLSEKQKKFIDLAEPFGKITAADFKKVRSKKQDIDEMSDEYDEGISSDMNEEEKWIQKAIEKKGSLRKSLGIKKGEKIPMKKLDVAAKKGGKMGQRARLAKTLRGLDENSLKLTEDELINLIENIVKEKNNISFKEPKGLDYTKRMQEKSKEENDGYAKSVVKKMKEYLSDGSKGTYEMNPKFFPKGNGELGEMKKKAYKASKAVEEYIENFAYPGLENTKYDEVKPKNEWITMNIEGSPLTGNDPEYANAVKTDLGEKINKKRKKNLYQKEKDRSYKRVSQPVDEAGEGEGSKELDDMFAKLESVENQKEKLVSEEMNHMKNLITYNRKTQ